MLNPLIAAAASALALTGAVTVPSAPGPVYEIPASLEWRVQPAGSAAAPGTVEFDLGYHGEHHSSMMGGDIPLAALDGLTAAQLAGAGEPAAFTLRRDAGDFQCKGEVAQGRGDGTCTFAAKAGFAPALAKRGIGAPGADQQFELALTDIGLDYVDELKREGYATPPIDDLVRAGTHGAGMRQLKAMDAAGYRFGDVATLVRVRDHGVSAKYIEALKTFGYKGLSADQLVRMRDHGVSASYIAELSGRGYVNLAAEELAQMRDHGVSAGFVGELQAEGYADLKPEQLERLRDHGVSTGFIRAANRDGRRLTPEELIQRRDSGSRD